MLICFDYSSLLFSFCSSLTALHYCFSVSVYIISLIHDKRSSSLLHFIKFCKDIKTLCSLTVLKQGCKTSKHLVVFIKQPFYMYITDFKLNWRLVFTVYLFDICLLSSSACMLLCHGPDFGSSTLLPVKAWLSGHIKAFHLILMSASPCLPLLPLCQSHATLSYFVSSVTFRRTHHWMDILLCFTLWYRCDVLFIYIYTISKNNGWMW